MGADAASVVDPELRLRGVDPALGCGALGEQVLRALQICAGTVELRIQRRDPGVGGSELQRELVVDDRGDHVALAYLGALRDPDGRDRSRNPRPCRQDGAALHLSIHGLHLGDGGCLDDEFAGARIDRDKAGDADQNNVREGRSYGSHHACLGRWKMGRKAAYSPPGQEPVA